MLITIPHILNNDEIQQFRQNLQAAVWQEGKLTAGSLAANVKHNQQVDEHSENAISLGNYILKKLGNHPLFISAAMPHRIYPPKFNRYVQGEYYGTHVDGAIMPVSGSSVILRSDISATLFLSEPDEYEGGELMIETPFGAQEVKLQAGDMVLYPSSSLHQVAAVTQGVRLCAFFWIQSLVRDEGKRTLLFDLDQSIQALSMTRKKDDAEILRLSSVYHNLVRQWAEL
jgi:PKHD-type hydroxylase